jgi:hypothetical protein
VIAERSTLESSPGRSDRMTAPYAVTVQPR